MKMLYMMQLIILPNQSSIVSLRLATGGRSTTEVGELDISASGFIS